jgi:hypothetical protein
MAWPAAPLEGLRAAMTGGPLALTGAVPVVVEVVVVELELP